MIRRLLPVLLSMALCSPAFAAATVDNIPTFSDTTGQHIKDSGVSAIGVASHVATLAALQAAKTTAYPRGVWRDDYAAGNGAAPLWYLPSASACSLGAGAGDNGSQVLSADGKCWLAVFAPAGISILEWGAIPNASGTDNLTALNAALSSATVPVIIDAGKTYYSSGQITVPDKAALQLNGTLKRISTYTASDNRAFVVQASTVGSSIIGPGTIDLNSPAVGNWLSGLAPSGNTANVVDRGFTITGATFGGLDWNIANQGATHTNDVFENITILNSGARGAYFAGMVGGHNSGLYISSTGDDALSTENNIAFAYISPYVTKATPPPVLYDGAGHSAIASTSTTTNAIPGGTGGSLTFTIAGSLGLSSSPPGAFVRFYSRANPANQVGGNVTAYDSGTGVMTITVAQFGGSGTYTDWNMISETGMCIFRGVINDRITFTSPICDDNLNAASDGIGIGENGITSSTSNTIGAGSKSFAASGGVFAAGWNVTIISAANVFANQMYGTVTSYNGTTLVVAVGGTKGSGTHTDWIINTEPGIIVVTNPIVRNAGLFGIDCGSNFHVTGGRVQQANQRGINIGLDLGGRLSNCAFTGTSVQDTGQPASGFAAGINWEFGFANPVSFENISLTAVPVTDDRTNPGTYIGQNVATGGGNTFTNVSYDMASVGAPPFGYFASYNSFGGGTDPHLDGSCIAFTPALTWTGGTPTGGASAGCYHLAGKTLTLQMNVFTGSNLNGATGVTLGLPASATFVVAGTLACSSPGGATCSTWANGGDSAIGFTAASSFIANETFTFAGTVLIP